MAAQGKKKGTSVQTYRHNSRLVIRLEYDHADERQSVLLNGELRSSFHCPPGFRAEHSFRGDDAMSENKGCLSDWKIKFAAEQNTFRIRYALNRRNTGGDDQAWYWWDRNVEDDGWARFPEYSEGDQIEVECETCGTVKECPQCDPPDSVACQGCGKKLVCPECEPPEEASCSQCGGSLHCEDCQPREPKLVHDVARLQEELRGIDANRLQDILIDVVGAQVDRPADWATVIERVLNEAECDSSGLDLSLEVPSEDSQ